MTRTRFLQFVAVGWCMTSMALLAATFSDQFDRYLDKRPAGLRTIRMTGMIQEGDAARLREMLTDIQRSARKTAGHPLATVELSSSGGDLLEGLKLGYLFREFDVATLVKQGDSCLSSCALAFLGGTASHLPTDLSVARTIELGGTLGFHNFYLNPRSIAASDATDAREGIVKGFNQAKGGAALLVHYAASLGVDPAFIARMLGRPPDVWEYVDTAAAFLELGICLVGTDAAPPEPQLRAINICNNAVGAESSSAAPRPRAMKPSEAKRRVLDHLQRNMAAYSVKGTLAAQLATVLTSRDDRVIDQVYTDLQSAGLPLPEIFEQTFEIAGLGPASYPLQCIVSLADGDPDRFDVVLASPTGFSKPINRPPSACGRLFTFDRSEIVNPERR